MRNEKIEARPATRAEFKKFYGGDFPDTVRAWVGLVDGKVAAFGGLRYAKNILVLFGDLTDDARARPVALLKGCLALMANISPHIPVYATPQPEIPAAERFLARLGFSEVSPNLWRRGG